MDSKLDIEVTHPQVHEKGHVEYEVIVTTQETLPGQLKACKVVWSVDRRFREFEALFHALKKQYGHQAEPLQLPPKQLFGTTEPEFIMKRQAALHAFMVTVLRVLPGVTVFSQPHLSSAALKEFLKWEERVQLSNLPPALKAAAAGNAEGGASSSLPSSSPSSSPAGPSRTAAGGGAGGSVAQRRMQARSAATSSRAVVHGSPQSAGGGGAGVGSSAAPAAGPVAMPALKPAELRIASGAAGAGVLAAPKLSAPVQATAAASGPRPAATGPAGAAAAAPRPAAPVASGPPRPAGAPGQSGGPPRPAGGPQAPTAAAAARPPGPPGPAPAGVPAPDAGRSGLLASIRGGAALKKAVTVDKSAPKV